MAISTVSMEKLVLRAQRGDKDAFIELMERSKLSMTRAALAILRHEEDAADAIAQTVMEAFSQISELRQPKYFKTWLTRALICNSYDILRQRGRYVPVDQLPESAAPWEPSDRTLDIRESLAALAENDRLLLTLHYIDGFKLREIAKMLGVKENTVKTQLARSRKRLRKIYLEREGEVYDAK